MSPIIDLSFLRSRRAQKRVVALTVACGILGAILGFTLPKWYQSVLTVLPAKSQKSGLSGLLGSDLGGLAGIDPVGSGIADAARIAAVLQSIAVSDAVIEKFDLLSRYDTKFRETARETLWKRCAVKTLAKPNLVQLTCEDRDPRFAQQILEYFAEYGNEVFRRVNVSSASEEVRFLERRVTELRDQADAASARMREFQEKYQIVDLDTQSKAVVAAISALNSQRISKQLELDYARTFSSPAEATAQQLASQLSIIDHALRDLEQPSEAPPERARRAAARRGTQMFPPALEVPKLRAELEKMFRDRTVAETTVVFALERLEAAKASEARDVSTFLVLDPPVLPARQHRPRPMLLVALSLVLGLAGAVSLEWAKSGGLAALLGSSVLPAAGDLTKE